MSVTPHCYTALSPYFCRNALLRLDLSDLHELEKTEWLASNTTRKICQAKGKDEVRITNGHEIAVMFSI